MGKWVSYISIYIYAQLLLANIYIYTHVQKSACTELSKNDVGRPEHVTSLPGGVCDSSPTLSASDNLCQSCHKASPAGVANAFSGIQSIRCAQHTFTC